MLTIEGLKSIALIMLFFAGITFFIFPGIALLIKPKVEYIGYGMIIGFMISMVFWFSLLSIVNRKW